jgi:hypothetical protein
MEVKTVQALVSHCLGDGTFHWQTFNIPQGTHSIGAYIAQRGYTVKRILKQDEVYDENSRASKSIRQPKDRQEPQRDNGWANLQAAWSRHS